MSTHGSQSTQLKGPQPGEVVSIASVLRILWDSRMLIVAGTVLCVAGAVAVAYVLPEEFESRATLLLMPSPFKNVEDEHEKISGLIPKVLTVQDYQILLMTDDVLLKAVKILEQGGRWDERQLEDLQKPSVLRKAMYAAVSVTEKTSISTEHSPVITLSCKAPYAEMARDLAQAWADVAVEESRSYYKQGTTGLRSFIEERYNVAKIGVTDVFNRQQQNEAAWDEEVADAVLNDKSKLLTELNDELVHVQVKLAGTRKRVEHLKLSASKEEKKVVLRMSPPATALFLEEFARGTRDFGAGKDGVVGYTEEVINPNYTVAREQLLYAESELKELEESDRVLSEKVDTLAAELDVLREESSKFRREKKQLSIEADVYSASYKLLADKLEEAKIVETQLAELADIKSVSMAVAPDKHISPKRTLIVAVALVLGFVVSCGGASARFWLAKEMGEERT